MGNPKGEGYASPAISRNTLVLFHRTKGMEVIEARNAQDGRTLWAYEYPVEYKDRYGYSSGPSKSGHRYGKFIYAHGVTALAYLPRAQNGEGSLEKRS